jgi:hypothetical protein
MHVLSILASILISQGQGAAPQPKPAPDRSGEAELKRVMDATAAMRNVRIRLVSSSRETLDGVWYPDGDVNVWFIEPNRFRIEAMDTWGDGFTVICDGKALLKDGLAEWEPATLANLPKSLVEAEPQLAWNGSRGGPLFYFLDGSRTLDTMASKDGDIKQLTPEGGFKRIEFHHAIGGNVVVFYNEEVKNPVVSRFEFDKLPHLKAMHQQFPDWYGQPQEPLTRQWVAIQPIGKLESWVLDVRGSKGRVVKDVRQAAAPKPPKVR